MTAILLRLAARLLLRTAARLEPAWPAHDLRYEALRASYRERDERDQPAALSVGVDPDGMLRMGPLTMPEALGWAERFAQIELSGGSPFEVME